MGGQYAGEVAAHFLVVKQELGLLKKLVAVGADVVGYRADGDFFKPKDSPEDCFYFGEEILAFAACFGSTEIVEYLLTDCKVDPWQRDSHGNTALHVLAWWGFYNTNNWKDIDDRHNRDKKLKGRKPLPPSTACLGGTFVLIMDKMKEKLLNENLPYQNPLDALNRQRRTPLLVAVQRGHRHMVHALLEASGESQWAYGRVECMHYPLTYIDEPSTRAYFHKLQTATTPQTDTSAFETDTTALELAVDKEDKALLCTEPLFRHIIEEKWDRYAWDIYNTWVFGAFLFVVLIFIEILLIPKHPHYKLDGTLNDAYISRLDYTSPEAGRAGWWRAANEITVLLVILMYLVAMISDLVGRKDKAPWSRKKFIRLVGIRRSFATVLVTFAVAARFSGRDRPEDVALGLMAIFSWLCLLNYTKGFKRVGPLVMVFYRVLKEDLARWALLWFSLFLGFAEAVYLEMHATGLDDWTNPWEAVLTMFKWTFTQGEFEQLRQAIVPDLAKIYWLVFSIITIILLLNVLIAMMNQSFTAIMVEEDQQWHVERAKIVLSIDKKLGNFVQLVGFQREERGPYYFALNNVIPHAKYMARTHSVNEQVPVEPTAVNLPSVMASANQASSSGRH
ncbi:hypothetical protein HK097_008953 [Rhizophlyctis rosea]|uniref:Ion transport domain-containing protein n=1 Tax=Rhizophlyctis rosea TaxID=64517 RepID=A0AAD5SHY0_9FUNG|nr:hypothetical protein HK097_008953 [Rhizophlyctis rosea]